MSTPPPSPTPLPTPLPLNQPPPLSDPSKQSDATGGVIPYKNPHALTAYYLGVFSVIPFLGFLCALAAVPLGISGLKKKKANPVIRGTAHAWIGIVLGSLSILGHIGLIVVPMIIAISSKR